ncbi:hypothetical protein D024_1206 [Vibrio parahaemolyticus 3259]|nr:hypothetical protein D024_1216 [Vibrio parahaemolyticus 3259]EQM14599.1 hypothetical protein D024_1206 [Vibrio parahaemolyticus 3259]ETJ84788.1 hypothetical protein D041_5073 [Vibrio parahaemolyticus EKP-008]
MFPYSFKLLANKDNATENKHQYTYFEQLRQSIRIRQFN